MRPNPRPREAKGAKASRRGSQVAFLQVKARHQPGPALHLAIRMVPKLRLLQVPQRLLASNGGMAKVVAGFAEA